MPSTRDDSTGAPDRTQPEAPAALARMQAAFARAITQPFDFRPDRSGDYALRIDAYDLDLLRDIRPRPPASSAERLGIYNQQYWFRLLTTMQEEYPLTERLLGTLEFNHMVMAYLSRWPSESYSLNHLSDRLARFLDEEHRWNQPQLKQSARLEYAFIRAFDAAAEPVFDPARLTPEQRASVAERPLRLQPHVRLVEEHWNLLESRYAIRRGETPPAPVEAHSFWVIYRDPHEHRIDTRRVQPLPYRLLQEFSGGACLADALDRVLEGADDADISYASEHIAGWFATWVELGWFAQPLDRPQS